MRRVLGTRSLDLRNKLSQLQFHKKIYSLAISCELAFISELERFCSVAAASWLVVSLPEWQPEESDASGPSRNHVII